MSEKTKDLDEYGVWVKAGDTHSQEQLIDDNEVSINLEKAQEIESIEVDVNNEAVNIDKSIDQITEELVNDDDDDEESEITDFIPLDIENSISFDNFDDPIETTGDEDIKAFEKESVDVSNFELEKTNIDDEVLEVDTQNEKTAEDETTEKMLEDMLYEKQDSNEEIFGDLEFENNEMDKIITDTIVEEKQKKMENSKEPEILQTILNEIKTIKADIDNIKTEINQLKQENPEENIEEDDFFNDDNETIALSDDELIDIIHGSDSDIDKDTSINDKNNLSEEDFKGINEDFFPSLEETQTEKIEGLTETIGDLENNTAPALEQTNIADVPAEDEDDDFFEFSLEDDDSLDVQLEDKEIEDSNSDIDQIDDEDFIVDIDEDDIDEDDDEKQEMTLEQELQAQKGVTPQHFEDSIDLATIEIEDIPKIIEESNSNDIEDSHEETVDFSFDQAMDELEINKTSDLNIDVENYNEEEIQLDNEIIPEDEDLPPNGLINDNIEFEDDLDLLTDIHDELELDNDINLELSDEIETPHDNDEDQMVTVASIVDTANETEQLNSSNLEEFINSDDINGNKLANDEIDEQEELSPLSNKETLIGLLQYLDTLLDSLPDEKIKEFANSKYFDIYKKIFQELGIK